MTFVPCAHNCKYIVRMGLPVILVLALSIAPLGGDLSRADEVVRAPPPSAEVEQVESPQTPQKGLPTLLTRIAGFAEGVRTISAEDLERRLIGVRDLRERVLVSLALARSYAERGEYHRAILAIDRVWSHCESLSSHWLLMCGQVAGQASLKLGRAATAVRYFTQVYDDKDTEGRRLLVLDLFRAYVLSGQSKEALSLWKRWADDMRKHVNQEELDEIAMVLANDFIANGLKQTGREILGDVGNNYPRTAASERAYQQLARSDCEQCRDKYLWTEKKSMQRHARKMLLEKPDDPKIRIEAFTLMGLNEKNLLPGIPVQKQKLSSLAELLEQAEFLLSSRQYVLAYDLLSYLKGAKKFGKGFSRAHLFVLLGRAANQQGRYKEGEQAYHTAFHRSPRDRMARRAYEGYLISLHYQGKYIEELNALNRFVKRRLVHMPRQTLDWQRFWLAYLAGHNKNARSYAVRIFKTNAASSQRSVRAQYWLARIDEKEGKWFSAQSAYKSITEKTPRSHYAVFARWRMKLRDQAGAESAEENLMIPDSARMAIMPDGIVSLPQDVALVISLVDLGLYDYARYVLAKLDVKNVSPDAILLLFDAATRAGSVRWAVLRALGEVDFSSETGPELNSFVEDLKKRQNLWDNAWPYAWSDIVFEVCKHFSLPVEAILGIMRAESMYRPDAVSYVDAQGLMQIMPRTAHRVAAVAGHGDFEAASLRQPEVNIPYGGFYLHRLMEYYNGNILLSLAGYNAGPLAVNSWIRQNPGLAIDEFVENIPYDQTRFYVAKIMRYMDIYRWIWSQGETGLTLNMPERLPERFPEMELF